MIYYYLDGSKDFVTFVFDYQGSFMIRAVIIDDESKSRETIREILRLYCTGIEIVAEGDNVASGIEAIKKHKPDLVMLDIKMPDGTGFDLLRKVMPVSFHLIFITAFEEFAIKAFKYNTIDYLTKPIDPIELKEAIEKASITIGKDNINERLFRLLDDYMKPSPIDNRKIILKTADTIHVVDLDNIIRCESDRNYTAFYIVDEEKILISKSIKVFSEYLEGLNFFRIHASHLINLKYLKKFKKEDLVCILSDGSVIPVSYRKRDDLLKLLKTI